MSERFKNFKSIVMGLISNKPIVRKVEPVKEVVETVEEVISEEVVETVEEVISEEVKTPTKKSKKKKGE